MKGVKIFCPDRKTTKEVLLLLFDHSVGRQAILLPSEKEYKELLSCTSTGNPQIYRIKQFPKECWEFGGKRPVKTRTVPDEFVPVTNLPDVSIDPQKLDLYEEED